DEEILLHYEHHDDCVVVDISEVQRSNTLSGNRECFCLPVLSEKEAKNISARGGHPPALEVQESTPSSLPSTPISDPGCESAGADSSDGAPALAPPQCSCLWLPPAHRR